MRHYHCLKCVWEQKQKREIRNSLYETRSHIYHSWLWVFSQWPAIRKRTPSPGPFCYRTSLEIPFKKKTSPCTNKTQKQFNSFTLSQLGRPACVRVLSPVMRSTFFSLWIRSSPIWSMTAFASDFFSADVIYMCMSRNLSIWAVSSHCSISSSLSSCTNHSKCLWWRFIQKKSTWELYLHVKGTCIHVYNYSIDGNFHVI